MPVSLELRDVTPIGPFEYRWPEGTESFDHGWEATVILDGQPRRFRYGVGGRHIYGRQRVHTVAWLDGEPVAEGVATDDHERTHALLTRVKQPDGSIARTFQEVPPGYRGLLVVKHRDEIADPSSPTGLAVKVPEDDLDVWARLAITRVQVAGKATIAPRTAPTTTRPVRRLDAPEGFEAIPREQKVAVAQALVRYEEETNGSLRRGIGKLTEDLEADQLVHEDAFAFLLAVLFDQQVQYGRAWGAPLELRRRLGHLDSRQMLDEPDALAEAVRGPVALHRYVNKMPLWILDACRRLNEEYGSDAGAIWADRPTARELEARLDAFLGISQKKAAMAVMLLWRNCGVEIREMDGCDVAVDIHLRRVFLRSGLAERDDPRAMIEAARELWPELPGALDPPAWAVGREWCHAGAPECPECPLTEVCPKLVVRASTVSEP
jgi:uncharacterized HhH-GPD family protein